MTLQIRNLTKVYGQQHAVNNISFEVGTGEIVGFLGPQWSRQIHHHEDIHQLPATYFGTSAG